MGNQATNNTPQTKGHIQLQYYKSIYNVHKTTNLKRWLSILGICIIAILFLPWTQNIRAKGSITTLRQEHRAQELNSIIAGRIEEWYVQEGSFVKKGDTILKLGEVKVDYLDPNLLDRTKDQINAKKQSLIGYQNKANTALLQIEALNAARELKLNALDNKIKQQYLKVQSDSMDVLAATNDVNIYTRQIEAAKNMLDSGVISLIEFEKRKANYQNSLAKRTSAENKFLQNRQELINLRIEKNSTVQDYLDKISKTDGERFASLSQIATTEGDIAKLENIYTNYDIRNHLYYVIAPQSGQIVKAKKAGVGEMIKEGEMIVEIVPEKIDLAVEMYVEPMDLPLISNGQKVRFIFDGFPVIVFSGWPQASYGTFSGIVYAVETNVNSNGKFRVLVAPDPNDKPWPKLLRLGNGAKGIALLKDVPIYYEIWRNINGFPPDYYKADAKPKEEKNKDSKEK